MPQVPDEGQRRHRRSDGEGMKLSPRLAGLGAGALVLGLALGGALLLERIANQPKPLDPASSDWVPEMSIEIRPPDAPGSCWQWTGRRDWHRIECPKECRARGPSTIHLDFCPGQRV